MKILIAEDDRVTQTVLGVLLRSLNHEIVVVANGREALAAIERDRYPAVISDWMMPEMTGPELCRTVRAKEADALQSGRAQNYTYFILLTSLDSRDSFLEGMSSGADDFLTKPLDKDQLATRLRVAERILSLQGEVAQLSGLLPICAFCKKIREGDASAPADTVRWVAVETYVAKRSEASFSHGVCPSCHAEHLKPQLDELRRGKA